MFAKVTDDKGDKMEHVQSMISDVEDNISKSSKERVKLVTDMQRNRAREQRIKELDMRNLKPDSKTNRGLIKRFQSSKNQGEAETISTDKLQQIQKDLSNIKVKEGPETKTCFWSHENSLQSTRDTVEELLKQGTPVKDIHLLFGLVGVPVSHDVRNYTDPMNIGINGGLTDVTPSDQCHLSQRSLWDLSGTVHNQTLASPFGLKSKVTAVIPIKSWNHPAVWKAYNKTTTLGKFLLSAQFRGTDTPLPQDQSAFTSATLLRTVQMWPQPNQTQASLMADLLDTIMFNFHNQTSINDFKDFPHHHIINNMASALAPMAKILESRELLSFAGSEQSRCLWRAVISNSIYWRVRRTVQGSKNKMAKLKTIVNIENRTVNQDEMKSLQEDIAVYATTYQIAQKFRATEDNNADLFQNNPDNIEDFKRFVSGFNDYNLFQAVEVTKALQCKKSTWRLKTQKFPYLETEEDAWQWLHEVHAKQEKREPHNEIDVEFDHFSMTLGQLSLSE
jgi:hypothetical protein